MFGKTFNKRNSKSKNTGAASASVNALTDRAALKIAVVIQCMQNAFTNFLNKKTSHFSSRTWKILIVVFGASWGLFSFYIISSAFFQSSETLQRSGRKAAPTLFITAPKTNDSLAYPEMLYDVRKSLQAPKRPDTVNTK